MAQNWEIRPKYYDLVKRYESEKDKAKKIQMKYKFIDWIKWYNSELTDAEIEYLQECICKVNLYD